jgi:hypothetical protein
VEIFKGKKYSKILETYMSRLSEVRAILLFRHIPYKFRMIYLTFLCFRMTVRNFCIFTFQKNYIASIFFREKLFSIEIFFKIFFVRIKKFPFKGRATSKIFYYFLLYFAKLHTTIDKKNK